MNALITVAAGTPSNPAAASDESSTCYHCGAAVRRGGFESNRKSFCCQGCLAVFELLTESGLGDFYRLGPSAGIQIKSRPVESNFKYLDAPAVRNKLVDFTNDRITRVTFRAPAIHCIACVWLLENLYQLKPGIGSSQVNFPRKEVSITFDNATVALSEVVTLLSSLGYEPELKLSDMGGESRRPVSRRLWLQLGIAGFAFGNIMLLSISSYLGLDVFSGPGLTRLFGYISIALAAPVLIYSAADYWRAAWISLRQRRLAIEVPIALGIAALTLQSTAVVLAGRGIGYFDSLTGLLFFLLSGKLFQQKTFDRLAFDRDYRSFFPLAAVRKRGEAAESAALSELQVGDSLLIRNGELIPADSRLVSGPAVIDYSFVTGESDPVRKQPGDHLYAGGRQIGSTIEVEMTKAVSQSYLTSLWSQAAFRKPKHRGIETLTDRYSQRFTGLVIAVAAGAAIFWFFHDPKRSLVSFTSVLIVACPCALALAAPFALGSAQRVLGRRKVFLKNPSVIETLAQVDSVVFDKTGTLTASGGGSITFHGLPLTQSETEWIGSLARNSTHPHALRIAESLKTNCPALPVGSFAERPGCGIEGVVNGREVWLGSEAWLASREVKIPPAKDVRGSLVHVVVDGSCRGYFSMMNALRPQAEKLIAALASDYDLALLSGDNEKERKHFAGLFGQSGHLRFNQSPLDKLGFIQQLQQNGKTVMMVGDGLNDAGALRQSDIGVAVVESVGAFSPASDVIMAASMVPRLPAILAFSRASVRVVRLSFMISAIYNLAGISFAARGLLSPVICAILMPVSSITVAAFACGAVNWLGRGIPSRENEAGKSNNQAAT